MFIGVDESGDFETDEASIYVAALIRPRHALKIFRAYENWLKDIPDKSKVNGEVKGWLLTENELCNFVRQVMQPKNASHIRYISFRVDINEKNINWLKRNQKSMGLEYRRQAYEFKKKGETNSEQAYLQLAEWLEKHKPKTLFKIEVLGNLVTDSIIRCLFYATSKGFGRETSNLKVEIDEAFGERNDPRFLFFWRSLLSRHTYTSTHASGGVRFPAGWSDSHPFMRKFVDIPNSQGRKIYLKNTYSDAIQFKDSKDTISIQIADIIASMVYKIVVKGEKLECKDNLQQCSLNMDSDWDNLTSEIEFKNFHWIIVSDKFKLPPPPIEELLQMKSIKQTIPRPPRTGTNP